MRNLPKNLKRNCRSRALKALLILGALTPGLAHAQDTGTDTPVIVPSPPAPQVSFDPQIYSSEPNLLNSTPIAGSSQSLQPIYYVPGLLDRSQTPAFVLNQTFGHNDNVFNLPNGAPTAPGTSRGDWYSTTTIGGTTMAYMGAQRFYVNGTYAFTRYRDDDVNNRQNRVLNAGWNWVFTSRCSGTLVASDRVVQSPFDAISSTGNNDVHSQSLNESAKCSIAPNVNVIFDSGTTRQTNSQSALQANNANISFLRGGLEYSIAELYTIGARITPTRYDYFDRSPLVTPGLATSVNLEQYELYYRRLFSPKLEFNGSFGFVKAESNFSPGSSKTTEDIWSASLRWSATPKISITILATRAASTPQDIVADLQISTTESVVLTYAYSPKLFFNAAVSQRKSTYTSSALAPGTVQADQDSTYATLSASYRITPLTSATASYSHVHQKNGDTGLQSGLSTSANIFLLGLNYQR